ncbi:hypothetical protein MPQ_1680 [Methylovorus sp. MP688]|nr:hypothetical protein MPQ_1680 [Methylovorus sp. MP688]
MQIDQTRHQGMVFQPDYSGSLKGRSGFCGWQDGMDTTVIINQDRGVLEHHALWNDGYDPPCLYCQRYFSCIHCSAHKKAPQSGAFQYKDNV